MGTIAVVNLFSTVRQVLHDTEGARWSDLELLAYLNEGQRSILTFKPNAYVKNDVVKLGAGTRQNLPADGVQLIDIPRNMGTNGGVPGRAIRIVKRELLDAKAPKWHAADPSAEARHYMYSPLQPKHFLVYPPQPATLQGYVEIVYGALPPDTTMNGVITVDDIYEAPLIDYVLHRSFAKDTEFAADQQRSAQHFQAFVYALTGKAKNEVGVNPNMTAPAKPKTIS